MTNVPSAHEPSLLDETGLAHLLRVTFIGIVASALAISALTLFLEWRAAPQLALVAAATCLVALVLSHSGWGRPALLFGLLSITYVVMHLAARSDGIENVGLAIVPVLIVVSGLLLNRMMIVLFTATVIIATAGMLAIRYFVMRVEPYSSNDMGDFFIFAITCATAALVGNLLTAQVGHAFQLLRSSENRYRRVCENMQDVYCEMSTDGTLVEVSSASAVLFGVPRKAMIGRNMTPHCVDPAKFTALLAAVVKHGRISDGEVVIRDSHSALRHVLINAAREFKNGEERVIGSIRDVTQQKQAEEAARDSQAWLRLVIEATGAGTFEFHPASGMLICSDTTKSHFGMSREDDTSPNLFLSAVHPDDRYRIRQTATSLVHLGNGAQFAVKCRTVGIDDGKERWIAIQGRMLTDRENRPIRLIGTTLDISEHKALEANYEVQLPGTI